MMLMTTYRIKPFLSRDETRELMSVFGEVGTPPNTIAHYIFADSGGGVVITDGADTAELYRNILNYTQWIQYETVTLMSIDDAVPLIMEAIA
jgi:hypothetical protein